MSKPTLWVIGDSFSQPRKEFDSPLIWTELAADRLGCELVNESFYGVSQDYCWLYLQIWIHEGRIHPEDYVVVVLTHPNRYWFIEKQPDLSNVHNTVDLDEYITREQQAAILGYVQHIQRPDLDSIQMISRLGWLAYSRVANNLRRPLVLKAFDFELFHSVDYRDINIAQGNLYDVQNREFVDPTDQTTTDYFLGADPRYNHMCLDNHRILADKVVESLTKDCQLDLTQGFCEEILPPGKLDDLEFCHREFNPELWQHYLNVRERLKNRSLTSWLKNVKINK